MTAIAVGSQALPPHRSEGLDTSSGSFTSGHWTERRVRQGRFLSGQAKT